MTNMRKIYAPQLLEYIKNFFFIKEVQKPTQKNTHKILTKNK